MRIDIGIYVSSIVGYKRSSGEFTPQNIRFSLRETYRELSSTMIQNLLYELYVLK